ncbi:MAG: hypothetical protein SVM80_09085 [Halobacteriota archaeon]|nr:hypothetical protein [Halobacteriota archaeon]
MGASEFPWTFPVTFTLPQLNLTIDDVEISIYRDLKLVEGLNKYATASVKIPYQSLSGGESLKIRFGTVNRFWGIIQSFTEGNDGLLLVRAISKDFVLTKKLVPYLNLDYTSKDGGWIINQLLLSESDWCDTSDVSESLGTISYLKFVQDDLKTCIDMVCDLLGKYWYWTPEDSKFHVVSLGDATSSTSIDGTYISEDDWKTDATKVYNNIYVLGGRIDGDENNDYVTAYARDSTSETTYGKRELPPHNDPEIIKQDVGQDLADALLARYKDQLVTGKTKQMPYDDYLRIGETVAVTNTNYDGTYLVQNLAVDFDNFTMTVDLSNIPLDFEQEIRDIQTTIDLLKRTISPVLETSRPLAFLDDTMRRGSSTTETETYEATLSIPFTIPITIGGLKLEESIHRKT